MISVEVYFFLYNIPTLLWLLLRLCDLILFFVYVSTQGNIRIDTDSLVRNTSFYSSQ